MADFVDALYRTIITAGTHKASSIKVAEAAKVIENTQRDVNIALINELAILFHKLGLNTLEVLEAAGSKWNFLPFRPGLVGGHCIGVDPYYLTHKAQEIGHHPEIILAGRRINDGMGEYVSNRVVKLMTRRRIPVCQANILILGLTFKENCPDIRNTRVIDIVAELKGYDARVDVHDPWADPSEVQREYGIELLKEPAAGQYDAVIVAVAHREFKAMGAAGIRALTKPQGIVFDVKYVLPAGLPTSSCELGGEAMKVLVTGTAGFIGAALSQVLLARGDEVIGIDNVNDYYDVRLKEARLARLKAKPGFTEIRISLENREGLFEAFATHRPRRVVNLAAQAGVRYSSPIPTPTSTPTWWVFAMSWKPAAATKWSTWCTLRPAPFTGPTPRCRSRSITTSIIR